MILSVKRYSSGTESTLGLLFIDSVFECYCLEDQFQKVKIPKETRIPEGTYHIVLREYGGHHNDYSVKFPFHKGMLEVKDVPGFSDILIHIGNDDTDTDGCLLLGDGIDNNQVSRGRLTNSTEAYIRMYQKVLPALLRKEPVTINYSEAKT